jgi:hypothetical protein
MTQQAPDPFYFDPPGNFGAIAAATVCATWHACVAVVLSVFTAMKAFDPFVA